MLAAAAEADVIDPGAGGGSKRRRRVLGWLLAAGAGALIAAGVARLTGPGAGEEVTPATDAVEEPTTPHSATPEEAPSEALEAADSSGDAPAPVARQPTRAVTDPVPLAVQLLKNAAPVLLRNEWKARKEELGVNPGMRGKGALVCALPEGSQLAIGDGSGTAYKLDAHLHRQACYHLEAGRAFTVQLTLADGTHQRWDWVPTAGQADCLATPDGDEPRGQ